MNAKSIGVFLLNLRKENNLLQNDIANLCNVTAQAVSKWERGESIPDIQILEKLSILYRLSINEIINAEKRELYVDIEKRNSVFSITASILVFVAYLFNFAKIDYTQLGFSQEILMRGYQVIFNGTAGVFVYLSWLQFSILTSHLLINVFIRTNVIRKNEANTLYIIYSSVLVIVLAITAFFTPSMLPFPQFIILIAMIVMIVINKDSLAIDTSNLKTFANRVKTPKAVSVATKILIIINMLLAGAFTINTLVEYLKLTNLNVSRHNFTNSLIMISIFAVISVMNIILHSLLKTRDHEKTVTLYLIINVTAFVIASVITYYLYNGFNPILGMFAALAFLVIISLFADRNVELNT